MFWQEIKTDFLIMVIREALSEKQHWIWWKSKTTILRAEHFLWEEKQQGGCRHREQQAKAVRQNVSWLFGWLKGGFIAQFWGLVLNKNGISEWRSPKIKEINSFKGDEKSVIKLIHCINMHWVILDIGKAVVRSLHSGRGRQIRKQVTQ